MQVFKNLWMVCSEAEAKSIFAELKGVLQRDMIGAWEEDSRVASYFLQLNPASQDLMLVVSGSKLESYSIVANASVLIYLMYRERVSVDDFSGGICIANIVPNDGRSSLTIGEYNLIVDKFYREVIIRLQSARQWQMSAGCKTYQEMFLPECQNLFLSFVNSANKSSAATHPSDSRMWNAFLISCARSMPEVHPSASEVGQLLVEDYFWDRDAAQKLSLEYEFGIDLLRQAYGL